MIQILFFFFAALAVGAAINVLVQKHVLYSALSLILMLTSVSILFIFLRADFLAVIQVIVYAGAIMVLFTFVIMLLNLPADEDGVDRLRWLKFIGIPLGLFLLFLIVATLWNVEPVTAGTAAADGKPAGDRAQPFYGLPAAVRGDVPFDTHRSGGRGSFREEGFMIPICWYLILGAVLFLIGVCGFFIKRNIIALLLSVEIMLNAVNLTFVAFSSQLGQISGQIFVFFVLVVAAAEAAVGLALVIAMFRNRESLNVDRSNLLKW